MVRRLPVVKGQFYEEREVRVVSEQVDVVDGLEYGELFLPVGDALVPVTQAPHYDGLEVILAGEPPTDISVSPTDVNELVVEAIIGVVTVTDLDLPNDTFTFTVSDSRFEIVDGILKLKAGQQLVFSNEPTVTFTIIATDQYGLAIGEPITLTVIEQIVPVSNNAPTDITLDNLTISDTELGGVVGTVTMSDPDMPDDTLVATVDDDRFVVVGGVLRLKPNQFVSHLLEPTIPIVLTVTDAGGLTATHAYDLEVTDIAAPDLSNAYFVGPSGAGLVNGSSFANCYGFTALNTVVGLAAAAGKQVLLASHLGTYGTYSSSPVVTLSSGGSASDPVIIRGVNAAGEESSITIRGNRGTNGGNGQWAVGGTAGPAIIKFAAGANHLFFKNIDFLNCGNGCFDFTDNVSNITIDTCNASNVRRFIESVISSPATTVTVTALRVRNCLIEGYSKGGIHLRYDSNNCSFENVVCDSLFQDGDNFAVGFDMGDTTHDITFTDCIARNSKDVSPNQGPPQTFYNGDGFTTERGYNFTFLRCTSSGNSDGGYDCKAQNVSFTDCKSFGNKENYKLWGTATLLRCSGIDPIDRYSDATWSASQVETDSSGTYTCSVTMTDCTFVDARSDTTAVFRAGESFASTITTVNTSVQKHASVPYTYDDHSGGVFSLDNKTGPVFVGVPTISAISAAGETSTVTPATVTGGVSDEFQWFRTASGGFALHIDDAVSAGYTAVDDDVGCTISCRQYTVDADGYMTEATSAESAVITASVLSLLTPPTISGPLGRGGVLTVVPGTYSAIPQPDLTYQWKVAGVAVSGETGTTYTTVVGDIGSTVTVVETADNGGAGSPISTTSAAVGPIVASLATAYVAPTGAGDLSGSSFANAIAWSSINGLIPAMQPGGLIYVAAHLGNYTGQVSISHGGTAVDPLIVLASDPDGNHSDGHLIPFFNSGGTRSPIELRGVDAALTPTKAQFVRGRTAWTLPYNGTLTDPFTTSAGSAVVNVHIPGGHGFSPFIGTRTVNFYAVAVAGVGAITVGGITITPSTWYTASVVDSDNFTITHTAAASSGVTGGGTVNYENTVYVSTWSIGTPSIKLFNGADNLKFSYMNFTRSGNGGAIELQSNSSIENLELDNVDFYNCQRFFEESTTEATVTGLYIHDGTAIGHSKTGFRLRNDTNLVCIEDYVIDSGRQDRDNFAECIEINDTAHDVAIRRCTLSNVHDTANSYWNADCIAGERSTPYILVEDCELFGATDGGFDIKANYVIIRRVDSHHNKNNLKLWGYYGVLVEECTLTDAYRRGGTGGSQLIGCESNSTEVENFPGCDLRVKDCALIYTGDIPTALTSFPGVGISKDDGNFGQTLRVQENTYTNVSAATDDTNTDIGTDALLLSALLTDVTGPVVSTATTFTFYPYNRNVISLTADESCSWKIVGGAQSDQFTLINASAVADYKGQFLLFAKQTGGGTHVVTVRAMDAAWNTTDHTITVTVDAVVPAYTFRCQFEGANGATTATDSAGGKTLTFIGNAQLTTTSPIQGSSSLLLDGTGDGVSVADHADWIVDGAYSVVVKFTPAVVVDGGLVAQWSQTAGNFAWEIRTTAAGAIRVGRSGDGSATTIFDSTGVTITAGTTYEVAVVRDGATVGLAYRLYIDGVLNATSSSSGTLKDSNQPMTIGYFGTGTYFNGRIDDVRITKGYAMCPVAGYTVV